MVVTICTASLTISNSTFYPHSVFMCSVWIWEQTAIISLYGINWLVFTTETERVYCAVRTEYLYGIQVSFSLYTLCSPLSVSFHTQLHLHVTLIKMTNGRGLGTFSKQLSSGNCGPLGRKVIPPFYSTAPKIVWGAGWAPQPVWTLWKWEKLLPLPGFEPRAVQAVASRYTDYATWTLSDTEF